MMHTKSHCSLSFWSSSQTLVHLKSSRLWFFKDPSNRSKEEANENYILMKLNNLQNMRAQRNWGDTNSKIQMWRCDG